ncbi:MAG TPA: hypothetical protein VGO64_06980, partial [Candidatus Limnocylindrales bacterium]|nr:hypothetical protein [Candidatus Limnocylindrales bacterium]
NAVGGIGDLIKIPAILGDVALGWLVWSMARELGAGRRAALIGAVLVVVNPVSWFDSVLWGQVDSFGVVFLLLGLRALWRDQPERSAIYTVIAALIKPQLAILAPIVAVVTIRRALWPPQPSAPAGSEPSSSGRLDERLDDERHGDAVGARPTWQPAWLSHLLVAERRTGRPIRIVTTGIAGFLTAVVLCFPFGLSVLEPGGTGEVFHSGLIEQVFKTAGGYPFASVNAYNPWALASVGGNGVAENSGWACDSIILNARPPDPSCPEAVMIGSVPAVYVGAALLVIAFVVVCLVVARRPSPLTILTGLAILAIAFFILPTRVHERYLYPFIAVGAILAAVSVRWRIAYVLLSTTTFLNMYVVLTTLYTDNPGIRDWLGIGGDIRSKSGVTTVALVALAASIWAFAQLRPRAARILRREVLLSRAGDEGQIARAGAAGAAGSAASAAGAAHWRPALAAAARATAGATGPTRAAASSDAPSTPLPPRPGFASSASTRPSASAAEAPTWSDPPSLGELGPIGWFRAKLGERPVRADRSRELHGEGRGRFDRLDLWLLVVLVVSILGIRMWRLAEPYQMHFDEVYHARTATEFVQDWRYGISHDIYEWTHPHLA